MVSVVWALISLSLGFLIYAAIPALAQSLHVDQRKRVGDIYYGLAFKSFGQTAVVRRILGGYELLPIAIDDEQKVAQVTLSSGMISDDKKLPFKDPDGRISRIFDKPLAVVPELFPTAVDPELAELGYWKHQHKLETGTEHEDANGETVINPYMRMDDGLRISDPMEVAHIVSKGVDPENIETAVQLTKQRYSKYGSAVGLAETLGTLTGFAVGLGGVIAIQYANQNLLDGTGGGPPAAPPIDLNMAVIDIALQMVVVAL